LSDDYLNYERERWLDDLYEEHKPQAIEDFTTDRLRSFYISNPGLARDSLNTLLEARHLAVISPKASLVLATAAAEVGLKSAILRPIVVGLVHAEAVASHVADLVLQHTGVDRFRDLLFALLNHVAHFDLKVYTRDESTSPLWEEIQGNIRLRNAVLHRCAEVSPEEAAKALAVASEVIEVLFARTIEGLGFHLHDGYRVCQEYHLSAEMNALLSRRK